MTDIQAIQKQEVTAKPTKRGHRYIVGTGYKSLGRGGVSLLGLDSDWRSECASPSSQLLM